ncbi:MAG TPA: GNAT family N-acetyltransferase [Gemmatimonadales bacterium]|nr:GNAT family N-acetyltransferase [Gemmatimonadales bacterium]
MAATIRIAEAGDAVPLAEFAERAFREAFGPDNRPADMDGYVAGSYGPARQAAELADPAIVTLLAEEGGALTGFVQLRHGPAPACVPGPATIEIWRFYVDRRWQGRGLAGALMDAALAAARARGGRLAWLAVWERNPRAQAFYRKCGFQVVGEQPFQLGADRQRDLVMARAVEG